jgi:hypothetical protein
MNNIKMNLREVGWSDMNWIDLVQERVHWRSLVNTVMNTQVHHNVVKFLNSCTSGGFPVRAQLHEVNELFS